MSDSFMIISSSPSSLDLGARPFAEQHAVAGLDVERVHLAVFAAGTRPDGDDLAFHRLFLGGVGDDDPARRLRLLLHPPEQHAVVQRSEFHENLSLSYMSESDRSRKESDTNSGDFLDED